MKHGETGSMTRSHRGFTFCLCLALILAFGTVSSMAAPKKAMKARPGDCAACHGSQKVLPADHKATKGMTYKDCLGCHEKDGAMSLAGKMSGFHAHQLAGVICAKCHGKTKDPGEVEMKRCVACHNTDKIAEKTAQVKPRNPHESPHYGRTLDCNLCHHQHAKSENYCFQCHDFKFVVP